MTTQNTHGTAATSLSEIIAGHRPDPLTVEIMARYARQEMMAKFLRAAWKAVTKAIARKFRNRAVYQELRELPDHLLDDIGIRRDQVSAIAYDGLSRPATDLELATGQGGLSFFDHRPAPVAAAPRDDAGNGKPLAA
jgi:uncharacterized protein YjiS (DUF1127 family)